ncbi:MAG: putative lipid II flippase FtsW [Oscillospiraceae bacterium]|nr:putative lipid II flippase FtsW [Oscillospiraceae bacterium]
MSFTHNARGAYGRRNNDAAVGNGREETGGEPQIGGLPFWKPRDLRGEYIPNKKSKTGVDVPFMLLTLLILLIGVVMVLSASFPRGYYISGEPLKVFMRQVGFASSGIFLMYMASRFKLRTISRMAYLLLAASFFFLVIVLFIGIEVNGARRWLGIGGAGASTTFQPSEIAKLAVILSFAKWICACGPAKMKTFKYGILPFGIVIGAMVWLLMREPHISASVVIFVLAVIMMYAGGVKLRWFAMGAGILAVLLACVLFLNLRGSGINSDNLSIREQLSQIQWSSGRLGYADGRIDAWLNPEADPLGKGFQIRQSLYAVGSGGLLGQGLGQSRQKYLYLPEEHNDYIFAIVCEELGFIGAFLILFLFSMLIIRGFWLAMNAKDKYSCLVTIGITSLLAIQVFTNVAVVTNLLPATGVSLPFFSYGGTALWVQLVQIGIVLSVSREIPYPQEAVNEMPASQQNNRQKRAV